MSVYFLRPIGMEGPIKIGFSDLPERRLKEMMMWSPFPLEIVAVVPGSRYLEGLLHRSFSDARLHWEWFRATPDLLMAIRRLKAGFSRDEAFDRNRLRRIRSPDYAERFLPPWPPRKAPAPAKVGA